MALRITVNQQDDTCVIGVEGEVDLYSSPDLRSAILKALKNGCPVGVNLQGVAYMDSSGVATLIEGLKTAGQQNVAFSLMVPSTAVMKVLQLSRLDTVFAIRGVGEGV